MGWMLLLMAIALVDCSVRAESTDWAWGKGNRGGSDAKSAGASGSVQTVNVTSNGEVNEESVIDSIVSSSRQGRTLQQDGYNQVASDPLVRKAIEDGNDSEARHYIREKLCDLGLMACEPGIEPKRPYVQPHDLIYAQPVHIKPVGRPIPAVPVRGPPLHSIGGGYGPPKPVPFPPGHGPFRPPRPLPGPIYGAPKPLPPPVYESIEPEYLPHPPLKKPVDVVVSNQGGLQQHVHHHYHHGDAGGVIKPSILVDQPGPVFEPGPIYGSPGIGPIHSSPGIGPIHSSPGIGPIHGSPGIGPIYGSPGIGGGPNYGSPGIGGGPFYGSGSAGGGSLGLYGAGPTGGSVYGGSGPYLGQGPFYKKELSIKAPLTGNGLGSTASASSSSYADRYPSYQNPRLDGVRGLADCVCVPYDQCLPHEVARKEDGFYIDPRHNGGKNIEAITLDDVVITDGNGTIISRHAKREDDGSQEPVAEESGREELKDELTTTGEVTKDEVTSAEDEKKEKRKRRQVTASKDDDGTDSTKSNVHPGNDDVTQDNEGTKSEEVDESERQQRTVERLFGGDTSKYKVSPTFGVSFGLPQGGGGGYPLNPYGPNPAINPYGGSVGGPGGLNLGLVNVNPLVSVQVTQDEYGDKIVKPLVNLHVTPNHGLVHKFGSLIHGLHHKPYYPAYPPYKHHHHHVHTSKPYYPSYYYPYKQPSYYYGPHKPSYHYAPNYYGYRASNEYPGSGGGHYYPSGYISDAEDVQGQYDDDDYVDDPYSSYARNSRGNQTAKAPNTPPSPTTSSSENRGSSKVQFPSDRRRGVSARTKRQADDDRDGDSRVENEVMPVQEV